ncbi:MAG: abscisic acid-deficient protein Aba4 family protein [Turneriella sp.]
MPRIRLMVKAAVIPTLFAVAYTAIVAGTFGGSGGDFSSLTGVMKLFTSPWAVTAGWIHYLAFDMFVGMWEFDDAKRYQYSILGDVTVLVSTFTFGSAGLYHSRRQVLQDTLAHTVANMSTRQSGTVRIFWWAIGATRALRSTVYGFVFYRGAV